MIVIGNLLMSLSTVVHGVLSLFWGLLVARIVLSWVRPAPPPGLVRSLVSAVYQLTDPVIDRARAWLPFLQVGALDLSPIAVFLALGFLDSFLTRTLFQVGASMA